MDAATAAEARERLATVPDAWRGFAYEGAGMGAAMLDGLPFGGDGHVAALLEETGAEHVYMIYVGVGWAMARLPRFRWPSADSFDPLLRGLVLDGYGFHQAYFHTRRYVHEQYRDLPFPWPDNATRHRSHHIVDQGIGRALWFVGGTDVDQVATLVERFPQARRADLYAGIGLAATYAGGVGEEELISLRDRAERYRPQLAQGSAFAAEARLRAGIASPHTAVATRALCGTTPVHAARITQDVRPEHPVDGAAPAYEQWRHAITGQLTTLGGVRS